MSSEKSFQTAIVKFLRQRDALVFNFIGNVFQSGVPDLFVAHDYWTGWMELKVGTGKLTDQQRNNLTQLRQRNCKAYVVRLTKLGNVMLANPAEDWSEIFENFDGAWSWLCQKQ